MVAGLQAQADDLADQLAVVHAQLDQAVVQAQRLVAAACVRLARSQGTSGRPVGNEPDRVDTVRIEIQGSPRQILRVAQATHPLQQLGTLDQHGGRGGLEVDRLADLACRIAVLAAALGHQGAHEQRVDVTANAGRILRGRGGVLVRRARDRNRRAGEQRPGEQCG